MATEKKTTTIKTLGDAFVITAGFKYETVDQLKKYGLEAALNLVDPETKDTEFSVNLGKCGEASKFGVTFTGANVEGYAEVTGTFPKASMSKEEKEKFLLDRYAHTISNLNKVQEQIEKSKDELDKLIATANKSIEIA